MRPTRIHFYGALTAAVAAGIVSLLIFGACSSSNGAAYAQAPPYWGRDGQCWFADDPAEVIALRLEGRCPVNWVAAPMPAVWRSEYAWYYDSPRYYDHYVPAPRRKVYVEHVRVYQLHNPNRHRTAPTAPKATVEKKARFDAGNGRARPDAADAPRRKPRFTSTSTTRRTTTGSTPRRSKSTFNSGARR